MKLKHSFALVTSTVPPIFYWLGPCEVRHRDGTRDRTHVLLWSSSLQESFTKKTDCSLTRTCHERARRIRQQTSRGRVLMDVKWHWRKEKCRNKCDGWVIKDNLFELRMAGTRCSTTRKRMWAADQLNFMPREFSQTMLPTNIDVYRHFLEVKRKILSLEANITRPIQSSAKLWRRISLRLVKERAWCNGTSAQTKQIRNQFWWKQTTSRKATSPPKWRSCMLHTVQQKRKHLCKGRAVLFSGAGALVGGGNTCFCVESRTQRSPLVHIGLLCLSEMPTESWAERRFFNGP